MSSTRHLAVIMFTDISGYTSLMGESEERALQLLEANRNIQKPLIESHDRELVKEMGDGILAVFNSSKEAVHCALEIQEQSREVPGLNLKIGIHLGDITFSNGDVFGDGVNVASRVQDQAMAGLILVTNAVYETIKNQENINVSFFAEKSLKNVAEPVKIYEIKGQGEAFENVQGSAGKKFKAGYLVIPLVIVLVAIGLWLFGGVSLFRTEESGKSSFSEEVKLDEIRIAILPIKDLSPEGDKQYFADGVMEDLITSFHQLDLLASPPTSVKKYLNSNLSIGEIGKELEADYIIRAGLRVSENNILLSWTLYRTEDEYPVIRGKEAKADYSMEGLTIIQKSLAEQVVSEFGSQVISEKINRAFIVGTENIIAYELVKKGWDYYWRNNVENWKVAIDFGKSALNVDSNFVEAYALLTHAYKQLIPWDKSANWNDSAQIVGHRGLNLDPECGSCYGGLAKRNPDPRLQAIYFEKSFEHDKTSFLANYLGTVNNGNLYISNRWEKSIELIESMLKYNPQAKWVQLKNIALLHYYTGNEERAQDYLKYLEAGLSLPNSNNYWYYHYWDLLPAAYDLQMTSLGNQIVDKIWNIILHKDSVYTMKLYNNYHNGNHYEIVKLDMENKEKRENLEDIELKWLLHSQLISGSIQESNILWTKIYGQKIPDDFKMTQYSSYWDYISLACLAILRENPDKSIEFIRKAIEAEYLLDISDNTLFEKLYSRKDFKELANLQSQKSEKIAALIAEKNLPSAYRLATSHANPELRVPEELLSN